MAVNTGEGGVRLCREQRGDGEAASGSSLDRRQPCGTNSGEDDFTDEEEDSSDADDDDDDDDDDDKGKVKLTGDTGCALRQLIGQVCGRALAALLTAHADLDDLQQQPQSPRPSPTTWQNLHTVLKRYRTDRAGVAADVKRDFRKHGQSLDSDGEAALTRSVNRLVGRVDGLFNNVRAQAFTASLSSSEWHALNACTQIWRKILRGCSDTFDGTTATTTTTTRINTCMEASVLSRRGELVICTNGQDGQVAGLQAAVTSWQALHICCASVAQWKSILSQLLPFGAPVPITRLAVQPHRRPTHLPRLHFSSVPPCVLDKQIVHFDGVDLEAGPSTTLGAEEVSALLERHRKTNVPSHHPSRPSLMASCIGVLKRYPNRLSTDATPLHLRVLLTDAYRCVSCRRIVLPPASVRNTSLSTQFQQAALSAGFSMRHDRVKLLLASLREGSLWLPPFKEDLLRTSPARASSEKQTVRMQMAGYHIEEEPMGSSPSNGDMDDIADDDLEWRFCVPCGAAHIAREEQYDWQCRCFVCLWENADIFPQPVWRRILASRQRNV